MLQKCDKNATQIPTYLVKLSVASEPDNRVQRCQEFHYKKTPRTCTFECTSIHYVFPPCSLHTLPFKKRFTYDFLPRSNIYISIYVHHTYNYTIMLTLNRKDKQRVFKKDRFDQVLFNPIIFYRPRRIEYY